MPRYSVNKTAAYARSVANLFTRKQAELLAKGYDATDDITALNAGADALPVTDESQEHAKSMQVDATDSVVSAARSAYTLASNALTTASGFFGKKSVEADEASRIRNEVSSTKNPAQVAAFINSVIAYLNQHKNALIAKKYNPTAKITELTSIPATLTTGKGHQEDMKGERGTASTAIDAATDNLFNSANDKLDAVIGLYGPDSEFVAEARRIRAALRGRDNGGPTPPPPPAPPAPPTP